MGNVIEIQGRFLVMPEPGGVYRGTPAGKPAPAGAKGIVLDLAAGRASVQNLSRDMETCQDAISLLEVTIHAAERIETLVAEMVDLVNWEYRGPSCEISPAFDVFAVLRDMRSRCFSIVLDAEYMGVSLTGPVGSRSLKPGLNPVGFGDVVLSFISPLSSEDRTYRLQAHDLSPEAIGVPLFVPTETGIVDALLQAKGKAAGAGDCFRRQSDQLKSLCLDFSDRWEKFLGMGHGVSGMSSALESARFLNVRMSRQGRLAGNVHDGELLRGRLQMALSL